MSKKELIEELENTIDTYEQEDISKILKIIRRKRIMPISIALENDILEEGVSEKYISKYGKEEFGNIINEVDEYVRDLDTPCLDCLSEFIKEYLKEHYKELIEEDNK